MYDASIPSSLSSIMIFEPASPNSFLTKILSIVPSSNHFDSAAYVIVVFPLPGTEKLAAQFALSK